MLQKNFLQLSTVLLALAASAQGQEYSFLRRLQKEDSGMFAGNFCPAADKLPLSGEGLPGGQVRCCAGTYEKVSNGNKMTLMSGNCDTSSCVENFAMKNLLCHSYGAKNFPLETSAKPLSSTKKGGSAICPYYETDKAICDTSYYNKYNNRRCRNSADGKNHCLGKVKCQSTGLDFTGVANNEASFGTDVESNKVDKAGGGYIDYKKPQYKCNPQAEADGLGAGTLCFYMGTSENWKVCYNKGWDDAEEDQYFYDRCIDKMTGLPKVNGNPKCKPDENEPAPTPPAPPAPENPPAPPAPENPPAPPAPENPPAPPAPENPPAPPAPGPAPALVPPPANPPTRGSGSGDPHFKTWTGEKYDYHGECDLVLVDSPTFMDGLGLKVHIRTTRVKYFSYIEKVAVMIGDDVLEFDNDVENFLINGELAEANVQHHKTKIGGFVVRRDPKALSIRLHDEGRHDHHVAKIDLHTRKNGFPAVIVDGGNTDIFKGSLGLLGDWETGRRLARDGVTELNGSDATEFALEWQVRDTEPMLFKEARFPQYPTTCTPPAEVPGFRLGASNFQKEAEEACAHWKEDMEDCIFDVIATRDVLVAEEGHIVHLS